MIFGEVETTDEISVNSYTGTLLIGSLPVIGIILLCKWSKDEKVRKNKQNLCTAYLRIRFMILYPMALLLLGFGVLINRCLL